MIVEQRKDQAFIVARDLFPHHHGQVENGGAAQQLEVVVRPEQRAGEKQSDQTKNER